MGKVVIGTSSWADPGFVEEWYPPGLAARDRLSYYAERFEAVEVNSTFYALPAVRTVERWVQQTPDGFTFDVKLHRLLSRHSGDLDSLPRELREGVQTTPKGRVRLDERLQGRLLEATLEAALPLAEAGKLSSFLLQLTPGFAPRRHELDELLPIVRALDPLPVAIELRHRGWVDERRRESTLGWFEEHGAVWVSVDAPRGDQVTIMPALDAVTHPELAYLRAHGRNTEGYVHGRTVAERFGWEYSDDELRGIGRRVETMAEEARQVRLMFNNNRGSDAPVAATRMRELVRQASAA